MLSKLRWSYWDRHTWTIDAGVRIREVGSTYVCSIGSLYGAENRKPTTESSSEGSNSHESEGKDGVDSCHLHHERSCCCTYTTCNGHQTHTSVPIHRDMENNVILSRYRTSGKVTVPCGIERVDWMRCICSFFYWFRKEAIWVSRYRAVLKEFDWMRCICALFDWFRKEAIWVSRYRRFPNHTKTGCLQKVASDVACKGGGCTVTRCNWSHSVAKMFSWLQWWSHWLWWSWWWQWWLDEQKLKPANYQLKVQLTTTSIYQLATINDLSFTFILFSLHWWRMILA